MTTKQTAIEFVKDSPIAGLAAATFAGLSVNDWILALGLAYAIGRMGWFCVECYWKWKDRRDGKGQ